MPVQKQFLFLPVFVLVSSCLKIVKPDKEPEPVIPPVAKFSYTVNTAETPHLYFFYNESQGIGSCLWDFGDSTTSVLQSPTHAFARVDTFVVKLRVSNEQGSSSDSVTIITKQDLVPGFTFTGDGAHAPAVIRFTNTTLGGYLYSWDFGDSTWTFNKNPVHTYTRAGVYDVWMEASDGDGHDKAVTKKVTVLPEYTTTTIASMKVINWRYTKPNGTNWDPTSGGQQHPDIYLVFEDSAGTQLYRTETKQNLTSPQTYTTNFLLDKSMWSKTITVRMMDDDGAGSEEMYVSGFRISDYGTGAYPSLIGIDHQYMDVDLNLVWKERSMRSVCLCTCYLHVPLHIL